MVGGGDDASQDAHNLYSFWGLITVTFGVYTSASKRYQTEIIDCDARVFAGFDSFVAVVVGQLMMERIAAQRYEHVLKKQS